MNDSPVDCQNAPLTEPAGESESLPLRQKERNSNRVAFLIFYILIFLDFYGIILLSNSKVLNVFGALRR